MDQRVVSFAHWVIKWRWAIIVLTVVAVIAAATGARYLSITSNYQVFFGKQNPQLQAYEALQKIYTQEDNLSFIIKPAGGDVFTPKILAAIRDLTAAAWRLPYASRVDSLTNFQHSFAEGDSLTIEDLVKDPGALDAKGLAAVRAVANREPLLSNRIVSLDGAVTNVNVTILQPGKNPKESLETMTAARKLAAKFTADNPGARVALIGVIPLNNAFTESGMRDVKTLVPLMYVILLVVMAALLRSVSATFVTFLVIGFSAATAMGLAGWIGIKLTPMSMMAPTIILTLAIADSIHVLVTLFKEMRQGASKHDAIVESIRVNFGPVFLTSLTTVIGFMSLNFSDAPPFHDLGRITAMGVTAAWIYSILFLPALVAVLPLRVKPRAGTFGWGMDRIAEFVISRRKVVLMAMTIVVVGLGAMIPRISLNDQFVRYFDKSLQFRADNEFAKQHLPGIYQVNWSLPSGQSGGISEPEFLNHAEAFARWLRAQPEVANVVSLTDVFRRLNKNMHGDDESYYRLPETRNLTAQYLLLYEMSLPYGLDLNNQINVDKSSLRMIATLKDITTVGLHQFEGRAEGWLGRNFPTAKDAKATSPFVMFAYISQRNIRGMLFGTFIAFLLISISIMLALRSVKLGLVSLVPNLVPAVMAFGIWSIFVGEVGMASSVTTATSLGVIVDATIHFLSKYMRSRRESGASAEDAVRYAFSTVGTALWVTAGILIVGFAVLALSTFKINGDMGLLTATAIAAALVADFLLLPALLLSVESSRSREGAVTP